MVESKRYTINLGVFSEPLEKQLADQGMIHVTTRKGKTKPTAKKVLRNYDAALKGLSTLYFMGAMTESETRKVRDRFLKKFNEDVAAISPPRTARREL